MQLFLTFKTIFPFSQRFVAVTSQWDLRPESIYLRSPSSLNNARVLFYRFFSRQSLVCFFGPLVGTQSHNTTRTVCSTWHGSCRPALPRRHNKLKNIQYLQRSTMRLMQDSLFLYLSRNEGSFYAAKTKNKRLLGLCRSKGQHLLCASYRLTMLWVSGGCYSRCWNLPTKTICHIYFLMGRGACKFHQPAAHVYIACADLQKEETQYKEG